MLIERKESTTCNARRERRLLQDELRCHELLQCPTCPDRAWCGGLKIGVASMSCLDLCCGGKDSCDVVCRRRLASYVEHVREIGGFDLSNVARTSVLGALQLPSLVPIFFITAPPEPRLTAAVPCVFRFSRSFRRMVA